MCVLAIAPKGVKFKEEHITACMEKNADGVGLAWYEDGQVRVCKGLFTSPEVMAHLKNIPKSSPVMFHARLATHGNVCKENCQPFVMKNGLVFAHNGIYPQYTDTSKVDSREFAKDYLARLSPEEFQSAAVRKLFFAHAESGGKAAVFADNVVYWSNGFHEAHGIHWSNWSYEPVLHTAYYMLDTQDTVFEHERIETLKRMQEFTVYLLGVLEDVTPCFAPDEVLTDDSYGYHYLDYCINLVEEARIRRPDKDDEFMAAIAPFGYVLYDAYDAYVYEFNL